MAIIEQGKPMKWKNTSDMDNIREHFADMLFYKHFTTDKTGVKTIELIGASFKANEEAIFGTPNKDYIEKELKWYESQSSNILDINGRQFQPPQAWSYAANPDGEINSNYGLLIFSEKYGDQYNNVFQELKTNPDSRRASMIYNRPTMHYDYCENGKNDFVCTNSVSYYIRHGKLDCVVQMRSNDVYFGYRNDKAWQDYVLKELAKDLNLSVGNMFWQVQNLHVYERHFYIVDHFIKTGMLDITKSSYNKLYPESEYANSNSD